jgi:ABC-type Fe3+/spermidine/putrescine transport system ATPase subunit
MLKVANLVKTFPGKDGPVTVIDRVSFAIPDGLCFALLGPSGCGKTTTLRCVAGLETASSGRIEIGGTVVSDPEAGIFVPVHERPIGMVFQSYAIWPHLNVFENVAYPLRVQRPRPGKAEIRDKVTEILRLVGMEAAAERPAPLLSGGQQQRVALARAIVREPALLLLDEPLSNLDARLREAMRDELAGMIDRVGITALYVTHDQAEAFVLARRMAVMDRGRIVQEGAPRDLYARPATPFIAGFLGAANLLRGKAEQHQGQLHVTLANANGQGLVLNGSGLPADDVEVMIRPEDVNLIASAAPSRQNVLDGRIAHVHFMGSQIECGVDLGGTQIRALANPSDPIVQGQPVSLRIDPARCTVFPAARSA